MEQQLNHKKVILKHLLDGVHLTNSYIYRLVYTHDGRKYISRLRQDGHDIKDRYQTDNMGRRYKEYYLVKEDKK